MTGRARVFKNNRCQAVRLPKEFRFEAGHVFVRREGAKVVLSAWPEDWREWVESGVVASERFMRGVADPVLGEEM
jgi:antitoxin VapB